MVRFALSASLVAVVAIVVAGWFSQRPSTSLVSVLSGVPSVPGEFGNSLGAHGRLLHEEPTPGSLLVPAFIAAAGDACVGRENACDLAFALEAVIPPSHNWPDWPEVYSAPEGEANSDKLDVELNALGDGGWEEVDGVIALEGVAARILALAPGPDARASALMEIPKASKAIVARFLGAIGSVPLVKEKAVKEKANSNDDARRTTESSGGYIPTERAPFARGHFGEVWRARAVGTRVGRDGKLIVDKNKFVLKRVLVERSEEIRNAGRREAYFGQRVSGGAHVARYESAFELITGDDNKHGGETELWMVFRDEGESLASLMYTDGEEVGDLKKEKEGMETKPGGLRLVRPSKWWLNARASTDRQNMLREMLRQTLEGIAFTHDAGVGHRDVKPGNLLVAFGDDDSSGSKKFRLRLADFGSAVDEHSLTSLYGPEGPSAAQQTPEYAPPECIGMDTFFPKKTEHDAPLKNKNAMERYAAYDVWSVGVLALEVLCLGTPKVFASVDGRTRAAVARRLQGASEETKEVALRLRAMLELCVVPQRSEIAGLLSWQCTEDALFERLKTRDPTGLGLHSRWALRLIRRLLSWDPHDRPSAEKALQHAYFRDGENSLGIGWRCAKTGSEFEFRDECIARCGGVDCE